MTTIDDAKRTLALFERRQKISSVSNELVNEKGPFVVAAPKASTREQLGAVLRGALTIDKFADELRKLISAEAAATIAEIDADLRELGVTEI